VSRGLKPHLVAGLNVRAEARTYLRGNGNDNGNDNGNNNSNDKGEKADPLRG